MAYCLIVDDEADIRTLLSLYMQREQITAIEAADLSEARAQLAAEHQRLDLCLTDMRLPDGDGLELVEEISRDYPNLPVAVITAHGQVDAAVRALKGGAFDFISKPIEQDTLHRLLRDARNLKKRPPHHAPDADSAANQDHNDLGDLVGQAPAMQQLKSMIHKVARSQAPVFIHGESGTGKELVAREIHHHSSRADGPFVPINCGSIPAELIESELFGHQKGAFTGANRESIGLFRSAECGTVFLDEIAELPLNLQVTLLRVLQERRVRPVGSSTEIPIDVRIISASHQDLAQAVKQGRFRHDLFYRLNVIGLRVPPLRERLSDLPLLVDHITARLAARDQRQQPAVTADLLKWLEHQPLTGNVRELENLLERAMALSDNDTLTVEDLAPEAMLPGTNSTAPASGMQSSTNQPPKAPGITAHTDEQQMVLNALEQTRWNRTEAARKLGLTLRQLRYRLNKWGWNERA